MTTPVKFELAKLLKEKGFDKQAKCYHSDGTFQDRQNLYNYNDSMFQDGEDYLISAPTIADVVMWLYEKYGIWIIADPCINFECWSPRVFTKHNTTLGKYDGIMELNSPTEAYEVAIEYCLTKLIHNYEEGKEVTLIKKCRKSDME